MRSWFILNMPASLVKLFASPYIAGDSIESALQTASDQLRTAGIYSTLDVLGEDKESEEQAEQAVHLYRATIEAIATGFAGEPPERRPSVSLKLSAFTVIRHDPDGQMDPEATDLERCGERARQVIGWAREHGLAVTIDMEGRAWTDFTLDLYRRLREERVEGVGTVLQTRLDRTAEDALSLPEGSRIRLVIGIYNEPPGVATTSKAEMKERMLPAARAVLERGGKVEFATHDEALIARFFREIVLPGGYGRDRVEVQMLLGVPRRALQRDLVSGAAFRPGGVCAAKGGSSGELAETGVPVRLYVPFAEHWSDAIAYARRRLAENPSIMTYGLHNLFRLHRR